MIICKECGHSNAEGTAFCKNPKCGAFLEWVGEQVPTSLIPAADVQAGATKGLVTAAIADADTALTVDQGHDVTIEVRLANKGRVVDQVAVRVGGEPGQWATVRPNPVNLFPGTDDLARITFAVPATGVTAGTKPFSVEAVSREDPAARSIVDGTLTVRPTHALTASLTPRSAETRHGATFSVTVENGGNTHVRARIVANDDKAALAFSVQPDVIELRPGGQGAVAVTVTATRRAQPGGSQVYPFAIHVRPEAGNPIDLDGTLTRLPTPPKVTRGRVLGARLLLTLLGGLLMVAGGSLAWLDGVTGLDLTYDQYVNSIFDAGVEELSDDVPTIVASVALPAMVLAGLAVLGLLGRKARLTKVAAVLGLLLYGGFAVTIAQAGSSVGSGVIVTIVGSGVALVGGLLANVGRTS